MLHALVQDLSVDANKKPQSKQARFLLIVSLGRCGRILSLFIFELVITWITTNDLKPSMCPGWKSEESELLKKSWIPASDASTSLYYVDVSTKYCNRSFFLLNCRLLRCPKSSEIKKQLAKSRGAFWKYIFRAVLFTGHNVHLYRILTLCSPVAPSNLLPRMHASPGELFHALCASFFETSWSQGLSQVRLLQLSFASCGFGISVWGKSV